MVKETTHDMVVPNKLNGALHLTGIWVWGGAEGDCGVKSHPSQLSPVLQCLGGRLRRACYIKPCLYVRICNLKRQFPKQANCFTE